MAEKSAIPTSNALNPCSGSKSKPHCPWVETGTGLLLVILLAMGCAGDSPPVSQGQPHLPLPPMSPGHADAKLQEITSAEDFDAALATPQKPVVAFFYLPGCGGCRLAEPVLQRLGTEFTGQANFVQVHANNVVPVSRKYGIVGTPMVLVFKNGEEIKRFVSLIPEEELRSVLKSAGAN